MPDATSLPLLFLPSHSKSGSSLFLTLTYDKEIKKDLIVKNEELSLNLYNYVDFVGIKNGKHDGKGYAYYRGKIKEFAPKKNEHVKEIFNSINNYFSN